MMNTILNGLTALLALPFVPLLVILLLVVCVASIVGGILKGIIRIFFAPVRFLLCFVVVILVMGLIAFSLFKNPVVPSPDRDWEGEMVELHGATLALDEVASAFKGVFSEELPLLAWRMSPVKDEQAGSPEGLYQLGETPPVLVRIQYLPIGSITVQYDIQTRKMSVVEGLGKGENSDFLATLLTPFTNELPAALRNGEPM